MIIYLILLVAILVITIIKTKRSLHMLQQNLYNENNRYLKWIGKNYKQFVSLDLFGIAIALIVLFVIYDLDNINMLALSLIIILYIVIAVMWINFFKHDQNKKPLVVTK